MATKIFHIASSFKAKETDDGTIKIAGLASTGDTDRVGDIILPTAWEKGGIEDYKKNPILLFNHNYDKPIGRATSLSVSDKGLSVEAKISSADKEIQQLIKDGVLSTFSVGFRIKDADYKEETDGFLIKDAELFEVSVVSVPCNQNATFSMSKSFDSMEEYEEYKKQFIQEDPADESAEDSAKVQDSAGTKAEGESSPETKETEMTPEEIQEMINKGIEDGLSKAEAKRQAEKAAAEAKAKEEETLRVTIKTEAEKIVSEMEKRLSEKDTAIEAVVKGFEEKLKEKAEEIEKISKSKRVFGDRSEVAVTKELETEAESAYLLGVITKKGWQTEAGKTFLEKVAANPGTGVTLPNQESWETLVSTNIERDIQHALILAPMFREIQMNSAIMKFPILPDAGYAQFLAQNTNVTETAGAADVPYGNLEDRDGNNPIALAERSLSVKNIKSVSFLGNEVEEDAIMPIMPLIRESIIRSHARTVENSILLGNTADGITGAYNGLAYFATANGFAHSDDLAVGATPDTVSAANLLATRRLMGKYGMRPSEVIYIVSESVYFDLIQDTEWQDVSQVANADAMKLKGSVGKIYGSDVVVCDEFPAAAPTKPCALAVNTRNFIVPRLRGLKMESEYKAIEQQMAFIATQRLGFDEIINGAAAVALLSYAAAA